MPVLLRGCIGIGHSAATHHSGSYYSIYAHIPGLRVCMPSTPYDAKGLFHHALRCNDPVLFLEHRELMGVKGPVPEEPLRDRVRQGRRARREPTSRSSALSLMVHHAMQAAEKLAEEGISIEIVDPRTVSPLDIDTILESVAKTGRLLIVDEAFAPCSVARRDRRSGRRRRTSTISMPRSADSTANSPRRHIARRSNRLSCRMLRESSRLLRN